MKSEAITGNRKATILLYRLRALLSLQKYKDGLRVLSEFDKKYFPNDTLYNWYLFKEIEFKLHLQSHDINKSYEISNQVFNNKSYKRQVEHLTEKWKIYHAYLVFLDNYLNKGDYKKFSLPKFLNSVPVNSKDKSGFNFAIRIIELLFQFARGEDAMVFHKMDALRVYRSRYLNDNTYKRNHLFLSLLLKSEKSGFDFKVLQKAEWQEIQDLRDRKHIIAEWEIIPYEELWDIFVELSKK